MRSIALTIGIVLQCYALVFAQVSTDGKPNLDYIRGVYRVNTQLLLQIDNELRRSEEMLESGPRLIGVDMTTLAVGTAGVVGGLSLLGNAAQYAALLSVPVALISVDLYLVAKLRDRQELLSEHVERLRERYSASVEDNVTFFEIVLRQGDPDAGRELGNLRLELPRLLNEAEELSQEVVDLYG